MVDKDPSTFTRSISTFNLRNPSVLERGKTETAELIQPTIYNIYKGTRKYLEKEVKVTYIKKIKKQGFSKKQKILTLDLETRMMGKEMIPVCVCIYDLMRGKSYSKLLPNSKTCYDELTAFLRATLIRRMYSGYKVYIHNMAGFDMVFILDALTLLGEVEMLNRGADNTLKITLS